MERVFNSKLPYKLKERFNLLNKRERLIISLGGIFLLFFMILYLALFPALRRESELEKKVKQREAELIELNNIVNKINRIDRGLRKRSSDIEKKDINLFSAIDSIATKCGIVANIEYMKPGSARIDANREEQWVEMRISKITLKELISLLSRLERLNQRIYVKRLYMKRAGKYLDIVVQPAIMILG